MKGVIAGGVQVGILCRDRWLERSKFPWSCGHLRRCSVSDILPDILSLNTHMFHIIHIGL